ncbi:hypothetical protein [Deferrisoma camini]|uniref:hypothetical protein n=1 Tax=Deferrisoma camini TaxID=1035120 RepID=UPI00046D5A66|nr:hypothetical protein [Deferrisoma camini]
MSWKDIGKAVAKTAPLIGSVLGGPAGGAAGTLIAAAFGVKDEPAAVAQAIQKDPEAALKLRELELRHKERWEELRLKGEALALEEKKALLQDKANARSREIELVKAGDRKGAAMTHVVALLVIAGFLGALWALLFTDADPGEAGLLLIGQLSTAFGVAVAYYLGSSLGSKAKDATIAGLGKMRGRVQPG